MTPDQLGCGVSAYLRQGYRVPYYIFYFSVNIKHKIENGLAMDRSKPDLSIEPIKRNATRLERAHAPLNGSTFRQFQTDVVAAVTTDIVNEKEHQKKKAAQKAKVAKEKKAEEHAKEEAR